MRAQQEAGALWETARSALEQAAAVIGPHVQTAWTWLLNEGPGQLIAGLAVVGLFLGLRILRSFLYGVLHRSKQKPTSIRNIAAKVVRRTWPLFLLLLSAQLVAPFTPGLPAQAADLLSTLFGVVAILQGAVWIRQIIACLTAGYFTADSSKARDQGAGAAAFGLITTLSGFVIWALAALMILANLNVEIAPIVAGLGVGGLAIGLAAQNIFKDLFASLSIIFDQPFVQGDFISFNSGEIMGSVEKIGMKTTRLRAITGEQIIVGNAQLLDKEVSNFRRMERRRARFDLGVVYQTPHAQLARVPEIVADALAPVENVDFDRCNLKAFGDSAIVFDTVFWVGDRRFPVFMDRQHAALLAIHAAFEREGLSFAYPTRTLHVASMPVEEA